MYVYLYVYAKCENDVKNTKKKDVEITLTNDVDMIKILDITIWVGLVYLSIVYQTTCVNSESNMVNIHVYVKCENDVKNAKNRV